MNVILSFFLCFAMIFSGTGKLPAEPETATTWTLSNVTLEIDGERATLAPEARLTLAAGEQQVALHFEVDGGERVYLPLSLEITPEELLFSLCGSGRAFRLSNEEFLAAAEFSPEDVRVMDIVSNLFLSYGAVLGTITGDPASAEALGAAVGETVMKSGTSRDVEITIDGQTYPATETELHFSIALLDELRTCGAPEVEAFMQSLLDLANEANGTRCASFTELVGDEEASAVEVPLLTLTRAEAEDLIYVELRLPETEGQELSYEIVQRGDNTTINMRTNVENESIHEIVEVTAQVTGPLLQPEAGHAEMHIGLYQTINGDSVETLSEVTMTEDYAYDANRLYSGTLTLQSDDPLDPGTVNASFGQSADADGSVTTAVEIRTDRAALSFDLKQSEGPAEDYFDGAEIYELTLEDLDSDESNPLQSALIADASQLSLEALQLSQEPSVKALVELFLNEVSVPVPVADDLGASDDSASVMSYDEAAAVYGGELADFTSPEGYVLQSSKASPEEIYLVYTAPGDAPTFVLYAGTNAANDVAQGAFHFENGALEPVGGMGVSVYYTEAGDVDWAYVLPPEGEAMCILLYPYGSLDDLAAILAGIH